MAVDWEHSRRVRFTKDEPPASWPKGVRGISLEGLNLLGIHEQTGRLHWDGEEIATTLRLRWFELTLAILATGATVGVFILELGRTAWGWPG